MFYDWKQHLSLFGGGGTVQPWQKKCDLPKELINLLMTTVFVEQPMIKNNNNKILFNIFKKSSS